MRGLGQQHWYHETINARGLAMEIWRTSPDRPDTQKSDVSVVTSKRDRCHGFIRLIGINKVRIKTGDRDKASANRKIVDPFETEGAISAGSGSFG